MKYSCDQLYTFLEKFNKYYKSYTNVFPAYLDDLDYNGILAVYDDIIDELGEFDEIYRWLEFQERLSFDNREIKHFEYDENVMYESVDIIVKEIADKNVKINFFHLW